MESSGIDRPGTRAYAGGMRWDALFEDMEAQLAAGERLDFDAEVAERTRADAAAVELADRLRGSLGLRIGIHLASGTLFEGVLSHVGSQSMVLDEPRHQVLIPQASAVRYSGLSRLAVTEHAAVRQRLGLASSLRALSRDRASLTVLVARGPAESVLHGVIDRVGQDFLDLALTHAGEDRRAANVRQTATIPFAALAGLRSSRGADS
ncbi:hypothetical protein [Pseudarthrobacter sp. H2]|uniref:hypothetical protein n=1 Tax=Pseudarthrobacter sp. H2 TaxID=3418415 RepID=UPI003CEBD096